MKKWVSLLGVSIFLVGCDLMGGTAEEESSVSSATESSESSVESSESSMQESSASSESSETAEPVATQFPLVPQNSELDQGITIENDSLLQQIQSKMAQTDELGIENDVAIHFTGLFIGEQGTDTAQAVFIIVNRTGMTMTNIDLSISMSKINGDVILDSKSYSLTEESFGTFEPDTVMPLYLAIPIDKQDLFFSINNIDEITYSIDSFDFEER